MTGYDLFVVILLGIFVNEIVTPHHALGGGSSDEQLAGGLQPHPIKSKRNGQR